MNVNIEQHSLASIWLPGAPSPKKLQKLASEVGRIQVVGILRMLKKNFFLLLFNTEIYKKEKHCSESHHLDNPNKPYFQKKDHIHLEYLAVYNVVKWKVQATFSFLVLSQKVIAINSCVA